jgi:luciferase family oxidoreductase group 1
MTSSSIATLPLSVLDLAQIPQGGTAQTALHRARELAQRAEALGYRRFWLAEHHNMPGIASAATSVAIGYVAEGTRTIRVGSGGIMLPNHAPMVIAEQFGTLDALYPGRIDLGLGRAPGTDQITMRALRRDVTSADTFPSDVQELQALLGDPAPGQYLHAVPGEGSHVPLWILGSSLFGAQLAAVLGLPYAFASHFAPAALEPAIAAYRENFQPSAHLETPHLMLAANVIVAEDDDTARRAFTSTQRSFIDGIFRRQRSLLPPPIDSIEDYWQPHERAQMESMLSVSFIGSPDTVRDSLGAFVRRHEPDEVIVTTSAWDQTTRLRSLELLAGLGIEAPASAAV